MPGIDNIRHLQFTPPSIPQNPTKPAALDSSSIGKKKGLRFWLIFVSLCLSLFLSAVEFTTVATALPVIVDDLKGDDFVWVGTAYSLASTAFLPMSGGLAEIFGRRALMLTVLLLFVLGSALCGSAQSMKWLIAARTVQGLGGGGILSLSSIIVSDLVPLRERGAYNGLIGLAWALATAFGPLIGGALTTNGQWRWLFYLNIPICGVALVMVTLFLKLPTPSGSLKQKLRRMDWIGNFMVITSTVSIVIGLTWGGVKYQWTSVHVMIPLILGIVFLVLFFLYEAFLAKDPIVPRTLLLNRTSVSGYVQTFITPMVVTSFIYYLPVYFQACKDATPWRSSIIMLGSFVTLGPSVIVSGVSVSLFKVYRSQLWLGWAILLVGTGISTIIRADTSIGVDVGIQIVMVWGAGMLYAVTYFPVLSPLPVSENAHALAFFSFCRSFAGVWGVTIGATVLQNELSKRLPATFIANMPNARSGVSLSYSTIPQIRDLPEPLKQEVRIAFGDSVAVIWKVCAGMVGIGLIASLFMKDVPLHNHTDEKWALEETPDHKVVERPALKSA